MKTKIEIEKNQETKKFVTCIAKALLDVLPEETTKVSSEGWEIVTFKDESANAFALPGKKIGVHTGMIPIAKSADALAAVIGHEIGHVIAEHGNERVSETFIAQGGLALVGAAMSEKSGPKFQLLMGALGLGAQFGFLLPHSRTQESEADIIGLRLMARAGFNPEESVSLWENMAKAGGGGGPEFLSTHPSHETRIDNLRVHIPQVVPFYDARKASGKAPNCRH